MTELVTRVKTNIKQKVDFLQLIYPDLDPNFINAMNNPKTKGKRFTVKCSDLDIDRDYIVYEKNIDQKYLMFAYFINTNPYFCNIHDEDNVKCYDFKTHIFKASLNIIEYFYSIMTQIFIMHYRNDSSYDMPDCMTNLFGHQCVPVTFNITRGYFIHNELKLYISFDYENQKVNKLKINDDNVEPSLSYFLYLAYSSRVEKIKSRVKSARF